jgi:hypothetical protein
MYHWYHYIALVVSVATVCMAVLSAFATFDEHYRLAEDSSLDHHTAATLDCPRLDRMEFESDAVRRAVQDACAAAEATGNDNVWVTALIGVANKFEEAVGASAHRALAWLAPTMQTAGALAVAFIVYMFLWGGRGQAAPAAIFVTAPVEKQLAYTGV